MLLLKISDWRFSHKNDKYGRPCISLTVYCMDFSGKQIQQITYSLSIFSFLYRSIKTLHDTLMKKRVNIPLKKYLEDVNEQIPLKNTRAIWSFVMVSFINR